MFVFCFFFEIAKSVWNISLCNTRSCMNPDGFVHVFLVKRFWRTQRFRHVTWAHSKCKRVSHKDARGKLMTICKLLTDLPVLALLSLSFYNIQDANTGIWSAFCTVVINIYRIVLFFFIIHGDCDQFSFHVIILCLICSRGGCVQLSVFFPSYGIFLVLQPRWLWSALCMS